MIKNVMSGLAISTLVLGLAACNNNDNEQGIGSNPLGDRNNTNPMHVRYDEKNNNDDMDYRNTNNSYVDDNGKDDISSLKTSINSDKYPETKAILSQDAKYKFIQIDPRKGNNAQLKQPLTQYSQAPNNEKQGQNQTQTQYKQSNDNQQNQTQTTKPAPSQQQETQKNAGISKFAQQVIDLTNKERAKQGLPALKADTQLSGVAQKKSQDMQDNHYFSHTSPTYGSPFDMMRDFGVTYKSAGENIAQGQKTPQEVVTAWMNSEGHRANILSNKFTHIGVGFEQAGNHWSQMFIGK